MYKKVKEEFYLEIQQTSDLLGLYKILEKYKGNGMGKEEEYLYLEQCRDLYHSEIDDVILELMDFVALNSSCIDI